MNHEVQQGEHLSSIASRYGFHNYVTIWQHPENAGLRDKRKNPNILLPGDVVFIPDRAVRVESGGTDARHSFRLSTQPLFLRIVLDRQFGKPLGGTQCELRMELDRTSLVTSNDGELEQPIPPTLTQAALTVRKNVEGREVAVEGELPLHIGHLDPIDEPSGWLGRLANLAYYRCAIGIEPDADELRSAVEEFQCDNGLAVDGVCGPHTQAKLKLVYGC